MVLNIGGKCCGVYFGMSQEIMFLAWNLFSDIIRPPIWQKLGFPLCVWNNFLDGCRFLNLKKRRRWNSVACAEEKFKRIKVLIPLQLSNTAAMTLNLIFQNCHLRCQGNRFSTICRHFLMSRQCILDKEWSVWQLDLEFCIRNWTLEGVKVLRENSVFSGELVPSAT